MDYTTLKNRTFQKYYFNSYLPGTLGAYESSLIFNYLLTLESIQENVTTEMERTERWIDDVPTWYTSLLPKLFFVPRYSGETDQEYIDRLTLLTDIRQNDETIKNAVFSVVEKGVTGISDILITEKLDGVSGIWGNVTGSTKWGGASVWSSETSVQRTLFLVDISFSYRGSDLDITTWDYWKKSENYTKIEDIVKLYKPPGSTFELRIDIPQNVTQLITDVFSNTLIASP